MAEDYSWGVKGTEVWDPDVKPEPNDSTHVFRGEHTLLVKQAVLGPEVPDDEVNVIEVEAMGNKSDIKLKGGTGHSQCVLDLLFPSFVPPVTFKLVKGNGPIHLLGNHSVGTGEGMADGEDDDEIDEGFEGEKNSVDEKKRKIAANSNSKGGKAPKRPKILLLLKGAILILVLLNYLVEPTEDVHSLNSQSKHNNDETKILEHQRDDCPLDDDELSRSTWKLLHAMVARYIDEPIT